MKSIRAALAQYGAHQVPRSGPDRVVRGGSLGNSGMAALTSYMAQLVLHPVLPQPLLAASQGGGGGENLQGNGSGNRYSNIRRLQCTRRRRRSTTISTSGETPSPSPGALRARASIMASMEARANPVMVELCRGRAPLLSEPQSASTLESSQHPHGWTR